MKKFFSFIAILLAIITFSACSDDKNEISVLSGTVWESTEEYGGMINARWTLSFQDTTFGLTLESDEDADGIMDRHESISGDYTTNGNEVTVTAGEFYMRGTFTETTMHFPEGECNDDFVYYKK